MTSKNPGRSASQADFLETPGNYSVKPLKPGLPRKIRDECGSSLHKMDETVKESGCIVLILPTIIANRTQLILCGQK